MSPKVQRNLLRAVEVMRGACEEAGRHLGDADDGSAACRRVLHDLAWGFANASSSIETAMAHIEDENAIREHLHAKPL